MNGIMGWNGIMILMFIIVLPRVMLEYHYGFIWVLIIISIHIFVTDIYLYELLSLINNITCTLLKREFLENQFEF